MTHADLEDKRIRDTHEPSSILLYFEDWYIAHVLLNPELAGVLRSLLGKHIGLPVLVSNHRVECPMHAQAWHYDADCLFGPETNFLEVFYFPQDTPIEMGPTELLPRFTYFPKKPRHNRKRHRKRWGQRVHSLSTHRVSCIGAGSLPPPDYDTCSNTVIGEQSHRHATGYRTQISTFSGPLMADTVSPNMLLTCSIGYAEKARNFASSADRRGPGAAKTRSAPPTDLDMQQDIYPIGAKIILMSMLLDSLSL